MATVAHPAGRFRARRAVVRGETARRLIMLPVVLLALWGLWEGYRWIWVQTG